MKTEGSSSKFFKQVENTVEKGEIAHNELFLLFPQCFPKICATDTYKPWLVWERVKNLFQYGYKKQGIV